MSDRVPSETIQELIHHGGLKRHAGRFTEQGVAVLKMDGMQAIKELPSGSIHLILSDIPYGIAAAAWDVLHPNRNSALLGSSPAQKKAGAIFKSRGKPINGWSAADRAIPREYYAWCQQWASEWLRVLKPGGSAIIFAGRRLGHRCLCALEDAGFNYKDTLAWLRDRAPHRAQRLGLVFERRGNPAAAKEWAGWRIGNLRPTFEPCHWLVKPYKIGATIADNVLTESLGAFNERAFGKYAGPPENVVCCGHRPGEAGLHPAQKPVLLMQALIELTTQPGQIVLDPFCGSGTTLVAARNTGRLGLGFENNAKYAATATQRLQAPASRRDADQPVKHSRPPNRRVAAGKA